MAAAEGGSRKVVALDLGSARIGVAASDETGTIAFARTTLRRQGRRRDLEGLRRLLAEEGATELVVGLPLRLDGSEGPGVAAARRFARRAAESTGIAVVLWDERCSSREAMEALHDRGLDARAGRQRIDAEAARVILQRYLDRRRGEAP